MLLAPVVEDQKGEFRDVMERLAREGFVRGIFDFSVIEASAVPRSFLVAYARLPQILLDRQRVIVAPQQEVYDLACAYAVQQLDFGNMKPEVVRALEDAYRLLGIDEADFKALGPP